MTIENNLFEETGEWKFRLRRKTACVCYLNETDWPPCCVYIQSWRISTQTGFAENDGNNNINKNNGRETEVRITRIRFNHCNYDVRSINTIVEISGFELFLH